MSSQYPPWKIKSRPCPFYQQGRCFFGDACNFVHDVSAKLEHDAVQVRSHAPPARPKHNPPLVQVHSPPQSIKSPRRSPRMSDLLLALQDVIGKVEDDVSDDEAELPNESMTLVDRAAPILAEGINLEADADEQNAATRDDLEMNGKPRVTSWSTSGLLSPVGSEVSNLPSIPFPVRAQLQRGDSVDSGYADSWNSPCPLALSPPRSPVLSSTSDILISPSDFPSAQLGFPSPSKAPSDAMLSTSADDKVLYLHQDSGEMSFEADSLNTEDHLNTQPSCKQGVEGLDAGTSILDIPDKPLNGGHDHTEVFQGEDDDSEDYSAQASIISWESEDKTTAVFTGILANDSQSPVTYSSPSRNQSPHTPSPKPAFDSPSNVSKDICASSRHSSTNTTNSASTSPLRKSDSPNIGIRSGEAEVRPSAQRGDATSLDYGPEADLFPYTQSPHISFNGDEAESHSSVLGSSSPDFELKAHSTPSTPELMGSYSPSDDVSSEDVSEEMDDESDEHFVVSPTAQLAYISSPSIAPIENDTLYSLYDTYSAMSSLEASALLSDQLPQTDAGSPTKLSPPSSSPRTINTRDLTAKTPTRSTFLRERVFTPPPVGRGRSGTVTNSSTSSPELFQIVSSSVAAGPFSQSRSPSPSPSSGISSPVSRSERDGEEVASRKVPFGFRRSSTLGDVRHSSLMTNRLSRSIPSTLSAGSGNRISSLSTGENENYIPVSTEQPASFLKPLRLSSILQSSHASTSSTSISNSHSTRNRLSMASSRVSSSFSISRSLSLSDSSSFIPRHENNTRNSLYDDSTTFSLTSSRRFSRPQETPQSAPVQGSRAWSPAPSDDTHDSRHLLRLSEPAYGGDDDMEHINAHDYDQTIRRPLYPLPRTAPASRPSSVLDSPHAIATPSSNLLFAIASDNVNEVRRALEHGNGGPNDTVGPQSALAFAFNNDQLTNKFEIVKTLLAYGADPAGLSNPGLNPSRRSSSNDLTDSRSPSPQQVAALDGADPATRYYIERASAPETRRASALIYRSFFRPLTRVRYELVGQDRALEQLFKVLSMQPRQISAAPIVVLLCGPSGHGKSLLARRFGSLLDVPTHTVNMTTVRSTHDLWRSYSMSPYEEPSTSTLAEFLVDNEGKRCVVVLDEIEKTADEKTLWSLLMPWELGRCSFEAGHRHIDVRNVIWLGTSNIGHDLVFDYQKSRMGPDEGMSREEYTELMALLRPRVSERLGASIVSRVTTTLPFIPFTLDEKKAIAAEALYSLAGETYQALSNDVVNSVIEGALSAYLPTEGARSLYRAVSNQLVDVIY